MRPKKRRKSCKNSSKRKKNFWKKHRCQTKTLFFTSLKMKSQERFLSKRCLTNFQWTNLRICLRKRVRRRRRARGALLSLMMWKTVLRPSFLKECTTRKYQYRSVLISRLFETIEIAKAKIASISQTNLEAPSMKPKPLILAHWLRLITRFRMLV